MKRASTLPNERDERISQSVEIFERVFIWLTPFVVGFLVLNFAKSSLYGGSWFTIVQSIVIGAALFTLLIRRNLSPTTRITVYSGISLAAGLMGLTQWGLLGQGLCGLLMALVLATLAGIRYWILVMVISLFGVLAIAAGFITGQLVNTIDASEFMRSPTAWVTAVTVLIITGSIILLWERVHRQLMQKTRDLRERDHQLRAITESLTCAVYRCALDSDWTMEVIGPQIETIAGYPSSDLIGNAVRTYASIIHPEDRDMANRLAREAINDDRPWEFDYRIIHADGSIRWVYEEGRAVRNEQNEVMYLDGFIVDVTERKHTEEALMRGEERLHSFMSSSTQGFAILDTELNFIHCNDAGARIIGFKNGAQLIGKNAQEVSPDLRETGRYDQYMNVMKTGEPLEIDALIPHPSLGNICLHLRAFKLADGLGIIIDDITEQNRVQEVIARSEARFRELAEMLPEAVFETDRDINLTFVNKRAFELFGFSEENFHEGLNGFDFISPEDRDRARSNFSMRLRGENPETSEYVALRRDGTTFPMLLHADSIIKNGELVGLRGIVVDLTERKRAEHALASQKQRLDNILRGTNVGTWEWNVQTGETTFNERWAEIIGYTLEEISPVSIETWEKFAHPDDLKVSGDLLQKHFDGELDYYECEARMRHKNGDWAWVLDRGRVATWTEDGKPLMVSGTHQDITDRKKAEQFLLAERDLGLAVGASTGSEETLRLCVEKAIEVSGMDSGGVYLVDEETGDLNLAYHCGLSQSMVEKVSFFPADAPNAKVVMAGEPTYSHYDELSAMLGHENAEKLKAIAVIPISFKNRVVAAFNIASHTVDDLPTSSRIAVETVAARIGEVIVSSQMEQKVHENQKKLRTLFDSVEDFIFVVDHNGYILNVNPAVLRQLGYARTELIGSSILKVHPADRHEEVADIVKQIISGTRSDCNVPLQTKTGETIPVETKASKTRWGNDDVLIGICRDITETKRLRELKSRSERLETAGTIAGQVAHDFNNLLAPLMAYPELIRDELGHDHRARVYLDDIENAARKMADINQDLLTLGRRGHYNQEVLDLNRVVLQAANEMEARANTITVEMDLCEDLMRIKGGASQIHRLLTNLLVNARDAVQDIGNIRIKTENYYADEASIAFGRVPRGEYVKLTVSDNGCGIRDDIIQKILDPFFTTKTADKTRGSGLGLSVVDAVMKDHNGYLDLSSRVGHGTSFYLYFPVSREVDCKSDIHNVTGGTESVLVVDDDDIQREVSTKLLMKLGYRVNAVASGEEAIELLRKNSHDLLILDMVMPGGIDGAETYRQVLEINPNQKAIILSGFSESDRVLEAQRLGAGAFVRKPITRKTIAAVVRTELDRKAKLPAHS